MTGIILAAGASRRLGYPKQLLLINGRPLVARVVATALESRFATRDPGPRVMPPGAVRRHLTGLHGPRLRVLEAEAWSEGMSASLKAGLQDVGADAEAVMFILADQPFYHCGSNRPAGRRPFLPAAAPWQCLFFAGRRGNPVVLARKMFPLLHGVTGDRGARNLIRSRPNEVFPVPMTDHAVLRIWTTPGASGNLLKARLV